LTSHLKSDTVNRVPGNEQSEGPVSRLSDCRIAMAQPPDPILKMLSNMLPSRNELLVVARSLLFMVVLFIVIWIPLKVAVAVTHYEAATWKTSGRAIETSKLKEFDQANRRILEASAGIALVLSQSAMWLVAVTKKGEHAQQ
jgi:hypothetical protein